MAGSRPEHFGLDQGPVVLMIENYRSGLLWRLMRECPAIVTGLRRAGFRKGWLQRRRRSSTAERAESRAALLPHDAYDAELLANVRPADWTTRRPPPATTSSSSAPAPPGWSPRPAPPPSAPRWRWWRSDLLGGDCLNVGCVPSKALLRAARFYADLRHAARFTGGAPVPADSWTSPRPWSACAGCAPTSAATTRPGGSATSASTCSSATRAFADRRHGRGRRRHARVQEGRHRHRLARRAPRHRRASQKPAI